MKGIKLTLTHDEADNLASVLLADVSESIRQHEEYQKEKNKDSNTKSIIALMKLLETMETKIAKRIYKELNKK